MLSAYGSLDLGYKSYITASITGRFDKSSVLPLIHNGYFYPSINLATVVSEYIKLPDVISFFKLRASYAQSKAGGTDDNFTPANVLPGGGSGFTWTSPYGGPGYYFTPTYYTSTYYNNQVGAVYTNTQISNNIYTADRKAYELGADIRLLHNRLIFDITRYHYKNGPYIINKNMSGASGYSSVEVNGDTYSNDGWEVSVTGDVIKNPKGLSWKVNINWFTYYQKWINYESSPDQYIHSGSRYDLYETSDFVKTPDGKFVIDPGNGLLTKYSTLGYSSTYSLHHWNPDWTWGVGNTLIYKNLSLHFQFDGMVGGQALDYVRQKSLQGGTHIETVQGKYGAARPDDELGQGGSFVGDGVNLTGADIKLDPHSGQITNMKDLTESPNATKAYVQDYVYRYSSINGQMVINKTFAKLREVTLSYVIPKKLFGGDKAFFQQASVSVVGRNLLYFFPSRYKDLDVDGLTQTATGTNLQTPTTRSFGINLNLTF